MLKIILLTLVISIPHISFAEEKSLLISEIHCTESKSDQWVEIVNVSDTPIDLKSGRFMTHDVNHYLKQSNENWIIEPNAVAIIANDANAFMRTYPDFTEIVFDSTWNSIAGTTQPIGIKTKDESIVSYYDGPTPIENITHAIDETEWKQTHDPSPGIFPNEITEILEPEPIPETDYSNIYLSELLPAPFGTDEPNYVPEYIEVYNSGPRIDIGGILLEDASGNDFTPKSAQLESGSYAQFYYADTKISLNNSGDTIYLFGKTKDSDRPVLLDNVTYENAEKGYAYAKNEEGVWKWTTTPTPGKENVLIVPNHEPKVIVDIQDKSIKLNEYLVADARESYDMDDDELEFSWKFGDGNRAYGAHTNHQYQTPGKYTLELNVFDGQYSVQKTWSISVSASKTDGSEDEAPDNEDSENTDTYLEDEIFDNDDLWWPKFGDIFNDITLPDDLIEEVFEDLFDERVEKLKAIEKVREKREKELEKAREEAVEEQQNTFSGTVLIPPGIMHDFIFLARMHIDGTRELRKIRLRSSYWPEISVGDIFFMPYKFRDRDKIQWNISDNKTLEITGSEFTHAPNPMEKSVSDAKSELIFDRLEITGIVVKKSGSNIFIDDGTDTMQLYGKLKGISDGDTITVTGYVFPEEDDILFLTDTREATVHAIREEKISEQDTIAYTEQKTWWNKILEFFGI